MNVFGVGRKVRLGMDLTGINGAAADPTGLKLKVRTPDGTISTLVWQTDAALVREATGKFYVDWPIEQAGLHRYRWESTGNAQSAAEHQFMAQAASF